MAVSISTNNLTKVYPGSILPALDKLNLKVMAGEVYGFLGANGAGKSTAIRLLMNFIQPTSGTGSIMGNDIVRGSVAAKQHVGYLAGDVALWPKVTGNEVFRYLSKLQSRHDTAYLQNLVERFEAQPNKRIDALSKGNRQKIGIIQALMHKPDVLILDEPTSGLDPLMQEVFYDTIREASARGTAVFVSSHNLAEAQRMCDRVGIIKNGKLIREQSIKTDTSLGAPVFRITMTTPAEAKRLHTDKTIKVLSRDGAVVIVQPLGPVPAALGVLSHFDIQSFATEQLTLEDEFMEYYSGNQNAHTHPVTDKQTPQQPPKDQSHA